MEHRWGSLCLRLLGFWRVKNMEYAEVEGHIQWEREEGYISTFLLGTCVLLPP